MKRLALLPLIALIFLVASTTEAADEPKVCPMIYAPVCAAEPVQCFAAPCYPVYKTYANSCMADDAVILHTGACTATETGPVEVRTPYTPPASCTAWFDGCNSCSRTPSGQAICTMRACQIGNEQPGRCTSYSAPKPLPPVATSSGTASSGVATVTVATTTASPSVAAPLPVSHPGFWASIWAHLALWLRF